jgi:hypothetical protein
VKYQPRTSEPSAERKAAICTKGHLTPRELAVMHRDYGQDEGGENEREQREGRPTPG